MITKYHDDLRQVLLATGDRGASSPLNIKHHFKYIGIDTLRTDIMQFSDQIASRQYGGKAFIGDHDKQSQRDLEDLVTMTDLSEFCVDVGRQSVCAYGPKKGFDFVHIGLGYQARETPDSFDIFSSTWELYPEVYGQEKPTSAALQDAARHWRTYIYKQKRFEKS